MMLRNLKALKTLREGPAPSVSIGSAGQVNVAAQQSERGRRGRVDEPAVRGTAIHDHREAGRGQPPQRPTLHRAATRPGKAIARLNAVKHGGLAMTPVVPHIEQQAAWESHLDATLASLEPTGHLETVLAGRVALLLWRLGRVARYEREVITLTQEEVEDDLADKRRFSSQAIGGQRLADVQDKLDTAQECVRDCERFVKMQDDELVTGEAATSILCRKRADRERGPGGVLDAGRRTG